jgi:hypothetical protein
MREMRGKKKNRRERGDQLARMWGMLDQQNTIISKLKTGIAERDGLVAGQGELISGLEFLNKGLNK